jgi:hypothetical protein
LIEENITGFAAIVATAYLGSTPAALEQTDSAAGSTLQREVHRLRAPIDRQPKVTRHGQGAEATRVDNVRAVLSVVG